MSCGCPNPAIHWSSDFNCRTCQNCGVLMVQEDGTPLPEEDRLPKPENMHGYCDQFGGEDFPSDPAELNAEIDRQKGIVKTDQNTFVHLRVHTHCSFLKATCKPDDIIKKAKENGQPAIAKTEFGNMCGAPTFVKKCLDEGIKPIIGTEFDVKYGLDANTEKVLQLSIIADVSVSSAKNEMLSTLPFLQNDASIFLISFFTNSVSSPAIMKIVSFFFDAILPSIYGNYKKAIISKIIFCLHI